MNLRARRAWVAIHVFILGLAACASSPPPPPKPTIAHATIDVQADVNPDARGRPSPVVLRLYELKAYGAFRDADFFALFDRDQQTLGADLVAKEEFRLEPRDKRQFDRKLQSETRYLGVVAAYRDRSQGACSAPFATPRLQPDQQNKDVA